MPTVRKMYRNNPADIPILVPLGRDFSAVANAIQDLDSHLKMRYPAILEVRIALRNPTPPPDAVAYAKYLHDASLVISFAGKAVATTVIVDITKDAVAFLKKRMKRVKAGSGKKRRKK